MVDRKRTVLVTGSESALGRVACETFEKSGFVVAADAEPEFAASEMSSTSAHVVGGVAANLSNSRSVQALIDGVVTRFGRLDLIFHCAEMAATASPFCTPGKCASIAEFDITIERNLKRLFLLMRYGLAPMVSAGGGSFVTATSVAALNGLAGYGGYSAASHAILGLTRAAALDVARAGVTVNVLCLARAPDESVDILNQIWRDAAAAAVFLSSSEARSVTAAHLVIDAGQSCSLNSFEAERYV